MTPERLKELRELGKWHREEMGWLELDEALDIIEALMKERDELKFENEKFISVLGNRGVEVVNVCNHKPSYQELRSELAVAKERERQAREIIEWGVGYIAINRIGEKNRVARALEDDWLEKAKAFLASVPAESEGEK